MAESCKSATIGRYRALGLDPIKSFIENRGSRSAEIVGLPNLPMHLMTSGAASLSACQALASAPPMPLPTAVTSAVYSAGEMVGEH